MCCTSSRGGAAICGLFLFSVLLHHNLLLRQCLSRLFFFDVCPTAEKSKVLGRRAALFVLGNCVGLAISYKLSDLQASIICLICTALSIFVHVVFWPETLMNRIPFTRGTLNPFRPLLFFFNKKSYRYLFFVMLVEQLAGAGFNALIFNYAVKAFNAGPSIITAALTTFTLGSAAMPGVLLPVK